MLKYILGSIATALGWISASHVTLDPAELPDTFNLLATVFSVLAGFVLLLASMNIEASTAALLQNANPPWQQRLMALLRTYALGFFFVGYIILLSFSVFLAICSHVDVKLEFYGHELDFKLMAAKAYLFGVPFMLVVSLGLPRILTDLCKRKLTH